MKSYFTDRVQCVRIDDYISVFKSISLGIPQGSVLGPILFLLFINDLPDCVQDCTVCLFADDVTLYPTCREFNYVQSMVETDLNNILHWFHQNRLFVNANKSNCLVIGTPKRLQDIECAININGTLLNQANTVKLLGLHIGSHLNWQNQTTELLHKLASKVCII